MEYHLKQLRTKRVILSAPTCKADYDERTIAYTNMQMRMLQDMSVPVVARTNTMAVVNPVAVGNPTAAVKKARLQTMQELALGRNFMVLAGFVLFLLVLAAIVFFSWKTQPGSDLMLIGN